MAKKQFPFEKSKADKKTDKKGPREGSRKEETADKRQMRGRFGKRGF